MKNPRKNKYGKILLAIYEYVIANNIDTSKLTDESYNELYNKIEIELGSLSKNSFSSVVELLSYKQDGNILDEFLVVKDYGNLTKVDANLIMLKAQAKKENGYENLFNIKRIDSNTLNFHIGSQSKILASPKVTEYLIRFETSIKGQKLEKDFEVYDKGEVTDIVKFQKNINEMLDDEQRTDEFSIASALDKSNDNKREKYLLSIVIRDNPFYFIHYRDEQYIEKEYLNNLNQENSKIKEALEDIEKNIEGMGNLLEKIIDSDVMKYDEKALRFELKDKASKDKLALLIRGDEPITTNALKEIIDGNKHTTQSVKKETKANIHKNR